MVVVAVTIGILFIKPTVADIRSIQDEIVMYRAELDKVTATTAMLKEKTDVINAVPLEKAGALTRFVPEGIDTMAIYRDIDTIADEAQVTIGALSGGDLGEGGAAAAPQVGEVLAVPGTTAYPFTVSVSGNYGDIKVFLDRLAESDYPLYAESVELKTDEFGAVTAVVEIVTFALEAKPVEAADAATLGADEVILE